MSLWSWFQSYQKKNEAPVFAPETSKNYPPVDIKVQRKLSELGHYTGPLNGEMTPRTEKAIIDFKKKHGLRARSYIGPVTLEYLFKGPPKKSARPLVGDPPWIKVARSLIGQREIKGRLHNAKILSMWEKIRTPWFKDDETPWCAGYVGYCFEMVGIKSTRSARARSYEKWEDGVTIFGAVYGCSVTFYRGSRSSGSGHVGFVVGIDRQGRLMVLGGNQGDAVNIKPFDKKRVTGYQYPKGHKLPTGKAAKLPLLNSTGQRSSSNEA